MGLYPGVVVVVVWLLPIKEERALVSSSNRSDWATGRESLDG
jgi:hypothetical protein